MGERLIKPYEISVWEDKLIQNGAEYEFKEIKLAVVGSDTMTGYNKIYNPVFNKKTNGEKSLSFSLHYKYFDPFIGNEDIINPFAALLINERKVKLHYEDKWYEFIIKDHTESSDGLEWTYTCTDAFVLELSKTGYNITFDSELNNNQGTAKELAEATLENTDWQVGGVDSFKQYIEEPIYKAKLVNNTGINIIDVLNTGESIPTPVADIYLFYSYVKNKDGKNVQFIIRDDNRQQYTIDDKNVITDTNFRITTELVFKNNQFETISGTPIITFDEIETQYQANRLAYNQLTTYDSVMERTVDRFKVEDGDLEIYRYTDYNYTTSNIVTNFITNGDNFNVLEDGSLQGWNPYTDQSGGNAVNKLELVTKPELATGKELADLQTLSEIEGFLKVKFNGALTTTGGKLYNTVYNNGIRSNRSIINSISKGQKFVFRWRAGKGEVNSLSDTTSLGLIVAKYEQDDPTRYGYYYKHIKEEDIILRFEGESKVLNNRITGGTFTYNSSNQPESYVIDGVPQTPSTKYIYVVDNQEYVWQGSTNIFVSKNNNNYLPYHYITAEASKAVSSADLKDSSVNIGIFIYSTSVADSGTPYYIQDIQLTRFMADPEDEIGERPIIIGNAPVATSAPVEYYYIKPSEGTAAEDIQTYTKLSSLADTLEIDEGSIKALYNEDSEKCLSISVSKSNCFNILQTIAETFECWVDLVVGHDEQGYITSSNGKIDKYVYLREYVGKENWAGFKYGINVNSIERNINSDEVVTKLIVDISQSDLVEEGYISIANAPSNQSGEAYILNFDYYYNQGLLNKDEAEAERLSFIEQVADLNNQIKDYEEQRRTLESALTTLGSKRNTYTELVNTAKENKSDALTEFESLAKMTYEEYQAKHHELIQPTGSAATDEANRKAQYTENDTLYSLLGELYTTSAVINNYSGLLTDIEQRYWETRKKLRGAENYKVQFKAVDDNTGQRHVQVSFNDFFPGIKFYLGESYVGETSVSKKFFDVASIETTISFDAPEGYTLKPLANLYDITANTQTVMFINGSDDIGVEDIIENLQEEKDQLTVNFNNKYSRYIQEGTWNSTDYIDSELYYLDAVQVSNTSAQPTVSYTINVVDVSQIEGLEYYLFDVGDKTYIEDTEFFGWANKGGILTPAREEVIVSEIEWHLEEPENNVITVQNYKTRFEDLFQRISAAVQTVQYNEATYAKMSSLLDANGTINQDVLVASLNKISGLNYNLTSDGSILIDQDRILVRNLTNPSNCIIINSEGIRISSDGGQTWKTAIDGQGINVGTVYTGTLNTNNVIIGNSNSPSFRWDKNGISAYQSTGYTTEIDGQTIDTYNLQTFVRYDQYGLYGIKDNGAFKAESVEDIKDKAHFAITWDGFFIRNSYKGGGRVEITSDNDFRVLNDPTKQGNFQEKIKIGALEWGKDGQNNPIISPDAEGATALPTLYGIRIKNDDGTDVFKTGDDGNIEITGTINALGGNFSDIVTVGKKENLSPAPSYIIIDGQDALIQSSNYQDGAGYGWMINADGDAVFNNITARGAIKTAVFEYAAIQAVGGIFIFRPSSTIRSAVVAPNQIDLILTVEKPLLFKLGQWCKISNYSLGTNTRRGEAINPDTQVTDTTDVTDILLTNGLTHVYKITGITGDEITLSGAQTLLTSIGNDASSLVGGALIDMGNKANGNGRVGTSNYGIGINSSDNTVNLPARAISLFETIINENREPKVTYKYRGILGTLPTLSYAEEDSQVNELYNTYLKGTQGIYTDNLYIGNNEQFIAFYTDSQDKKHLQIDAQELTFKAGEYSKAADNKQHFVYLSNKDYGTEVEIGNSGLKSDWRQIIGNKFGVDKAGNLYASNATISGNIQATSGIIGGASIIDGQLVVNESQVAGLTDNLDEIRNEASIKGYTLSVETDYNTALETEITLTAHLYYGSQDVTENFAETLFYWYLKSETGVVDYGNGYSITFDRDNAGYGSTMVCNFAIDEEILLTTPDSKALTTPDDYILTARV